MSQQMRVSLCHNAPVVTCEGNSWDVKPESIKRGSTYYYGCMECREATDTKLINVTTRVRGDDTPQEEQYPEWLEDTIMRLVVITQAPADPRAPIVAFAQTMAAITAKIEQEKLAARIDEIMLTDDESYAGTWTTYEEYYDYLTDRLATLKKQQEL